jgi:hypothetical protein
MNVSVTGGALGNGVTSPPCGSSPTCVSNIERNEETRAMQQSWVPLERVVCGEPGSSLIASVAVGVPLERVVCGEQWEKSVDELPAPDRWRRSS